MRCFPQGCRGNSIFGICDMHLVSMLFSVRGMGVRLMEPKLSGWRKLQQIINYYIGMEITLYMEIISLFFFKNLAVVSYCNY
jgi:hypothetical protein